MSFDSSKLGRHKVGTNAYAILSIALHKLFYVFVVVLVKIVMPLDSSLLVESKRKGLIYLSQHILFPQVPFHVRGFYRDAFLVMLDSVLVLRLR